MAEDVKSVVDVGRAQRGGDWPKPGDEGFVHPDGTPQSAQQLLENREAALNREAAGSGVHGAPGAGGVSVSAPEVEPSAMAEGRAEHTEWVREGLADLAAEDAPVDEPKGRHESPAAKSSDTSSKGV